MHKKWQKERETGTAARHASQKQQPCGILWSAAHGCDSTSWLNRFERRWKNDMKKNQKVCQNICRNICPAIELSFRKHTRVNAGISQDDGNSIFTSHESLTHPRARHLSRHWSISGRPLPDRGGVMIGLRAKSVSRKWPRRHCFLPSPFSFWELIFLNIPISASVLELLFFLRESLCSRQKRTLATLALRMLPSFGVTKRCELSQALLPLFHSDHFPLSFRFTITWPTKQS